MAMHGLRRAAGVSPLVLLALVVLAAACGDEPAPTEGGGPCHPGERVTISGAIVCVYEPIVIETGFECPDAFPHRYEYIDVIVCAADDQLSDDQLEEARESYRDTHPPVDSGPLTLAVRVETTGHWGGLTPPTFSITPVADATVAVDPPGGERIEGTTDAHGLVSFEVAQWTVFQPATITAYAEGYRMTSLMDVKRPDAGAAVPVQLWPQFPSPDTYEIVPVGGLVLNSAVDPFDPSVEGFQVRIDRAFPEPWSASSVTSDDWSVNVIRGQPFRLIARTSGCWWLAPNSFTCWLDWAMIEHPGVMEPTALMIDMAADGLAPSSLSGAFLAPPRDDGPLESEGRAFVAVYPADLPWHQIIGHPTRLRRPDYDRTRFTYDLDYVTVPGAGGHLFRYWVEGESPVLSEAYGVGLPEGEQPQLLEHGGGGRLDRL